MRFANDPSHPEFRGLTWSFDASRDVATTTEIGATFFLRNLNTGSHSVSPFSAYEATASSGWSAVCLDPGEYFWSVDIACTPRDYSEPPPPRFQWNGTFTVTHAAPELVARLLDPPTDEANVVVSYAFGTYAGFPTLRVVGGIGIEPRYLSGEWRLLLAPGRHQIVADGCSRYPWGGVHAMATIDVPAAASPPQIVFPAAAGERVLIHKYGPDAYPSPEQTADRTVRIDTLVHTAAGQPVAGQRVYFRVVDPPDSAAYAVRAGDAREGDNADGPGVLMEPSAVSGSDGRASTHLVVTGYAAGDNYQVEASLDPSFSCETSPCARSGVYTAWKRVYVEVNKMFRRGAYITTDVEAGSKDVEVSDVRPFPRPPFRVRLVHAPPLLGSSAAFHDEVVTIVAVEAQRAFRGPRPGRLRIDPAPEVPGLRFAYRAAVPMGGDELPRRYFADGVGLITGDRAADYFLPNATLVNDAFAGAFTEYVWLTNAGPSDADLQASQPRLFYDGAIPFEPVIDEPGEPYQSEWMARRWLRSAERQEEQRNAKPNHQVLFTAARHPSFHGLTRVGSGFNDLWLFVEQMRDRTLIGEALVHELAHEWRVNRTVRPGATTGMPGGHCDASTGAVQRMAGRPLQCTMTSDLYGDPDEPERNDGIVGFHYLRIGSTIDSEYVHIRLRSEPVPQNENQRTGVR